MKNTRKFMSHEFMGPFLDHIRMTDINAQLIHEYPFSIKLIRNISQITFPTQVTFFVGENGSGKSTLLEAIAVKAGLGAEGGSRNMVERTAEEYAHRGIDLLADHLTLSWRSKPHNSYFFKAESFFALANHLDIIAKIDGAAYTPYGGKPLHAQSHGESFLAFFTHRLGKNGFFIFDEPEAALSPQRQLTLLAIMHEACKNPSTQFIIATHSPILLAYPNATIYSFDSDKIEKIAYTDTKHYQITKQFLNNPQQYLQYLFNP